MLSDFICAWCLVKRALLLHSSQARLLLLEAAGGRGERSSGSSLWQALRLWRAQLESLPCNMTAPIIAAPDPRAEGVKPGRSVHKVVDSEPMRILRYS